MASSGSDDNSPVGPAVIESNAVTTNEPNPLSRRLAEVQGEVLLVEVLMKKLIAEVASKNRTQEQAYEYTKDLRATAEAFIKNVNIEDNALSRIMVGRMSTTLNAIFSGISFKKS